MYVKADGLLYRELLREIHDKVDLDWYLEVGCFRGDCFRSVKTKTVAVDPNFKIRDNVMGAKQVLMLFQIPSDAFFANGFLGRTGIKPDFSFLDGMHLFEFLLRDFIGTETYSSRRSVIALHDCVPFNAEMTTRDLDNLPQGAWTGDVWKLLPILREYRPDLTVTVLDASPTAIVLISNLDPSSTVLRDKYQEIVDRYMSVTIEDYGPERFAAEFPMTSTAAYIQAGLPAFSALPKKAVLA